VIDFAVDGQPVPQGSMKVINGRVIHSQGSALAAWRAAVGLAARQAGATPTEAPVTLDMVFTLARPKTVKRPYPSVAPDLDKLVRAVLDGLTAIAYRDDGQVVEVRASKQYGETPGVRVLLAERSTDPETPQKLFPTNT
jgi:crossover junction endodeoxyribonuclease RusA